MQNTFLLMTCAAAEMLAAAGENLRAGDKTYGGAAWRGCKPA